MPDVREIAVRAEVKDRVNHSMRGFEAYLDGKRQHLTDDAAVTICLRKLREVYRDLYTLRVHYGE